MVLPLRLMVDSNGYGVPVGGSRGREGASGGLYGAKYIPLTQTGTPACMQIVAASDVDGPTGGMRHLPESLTAVSNARHPVRENARRKKTAAIGVVSRWPPNYICASRPSRTFSSSLITRPGVGPA